MLPTTVRILVCTTPQDMRRSFDRLALVVKESLGEDPQNGALFVFVGKSSTRAKVLWWDRNGYSCSPSITPGAFLASNPTFNFRPNPTYPQGHSSASEREITSDRR